METGCLEGGMSVPTQANFVWQRGQAFPRPPKTKPAKEGAVQLHS